MMAGHPAKRLPGIEQFERAHHMMTLRRPKTENESLRSWREMFETPAAYAAHGPEGEMRGRLPEGMYGAPGSGRDWWTRPIGEAARGETGGLGAMLPHPSLRGERNRPTPEQASFKFTKFGDMNDQLTMANTLVSDMALYMEAASNPEYSGEQRQRALDILQASLNPSSFRTRGNQDEIILPGVVDPRQRVVVYKKGQQQLALVMDEFAKKRAFTLANTHFKLPMENAVKLVEDHLGTDVSELADIVMQKFFGLYYDAMRGASSEDPEEAAVAEEQVQQIGPAPLMYMKEMIDYGLRQILPKIIDRSGLMSERSYNATLGGDSTATGED
jgi:hypothetical protein